MAFNEVLNFVIRIVTTTIAQKESKASYEERQSAKLLYYTKSINGKQLAREQK